MAASPLCQTPDHRSLTLPFPPIAQVTTFADELGSLQDEINAAIIEKGRQSRYDSDLWVGELDVHRVT